MKKSRRATVLTVDAGPNRRANARFYRLVVGGRADAVHEHLLVPDGARLHTTHRHADDPAGDTDRPDQAEAA